MVISSQAPQHDPGLVAEVTSQPTDVKSIDGRTARALRTRQAIVDATLALALIHHLAISNNLPLTKIAEFLATITKDLLIEFVPKSDSKVKILLATRPDIFPDYDFEHFVAAFSRHFAILRQSPIPSSDRIVGHMRRLA